MINILGIIDFVFVKYREVKLYRTWHFSADISICSNPGGGGRAWGWNMGGAIGSRGVVDGLPGGGGGNVIVFNGCGGPKNGKCNPLDAA